MNKRQLIVVWGIGLVLFLTGLAYFVFPYFYSQLSYEDLGLQRPIYILLTIIYLIAILTSKVIRAHLKKPKFIIWTCAILISSICLKYTIEPFGLDRLFVSIIPILILSSLLIYTLRDKKK